MTGLKSLRKRKKITLQQLAEGVGCGVSTLNNFELGRSVLSDDLLKKVAQFLKVDARDLLNEPLKVKEAENLKQVILRPGAITAIASKEGVVNKEAMKLIASMDSNNELIRKIRHVLLDTQISDEIKRAAALVYLDEIEMRFTSGHFTPSDEDLGKVVFELPKDVAIQRGHPSSKGGVLKPPP